MLMLVIIRRHANLVSTDWDLEKRECLRNTIKIISFMSHFWTSICFSQMLTWDRKKPGGIHGQTDLSEQKTEPTNSNHIWCSVLNRTRASLVDGKYFYHWASSTPTFLYMSRTHFSMRREVLLLYHYICYMRESSVTKLYVHLVKCARIQWHSCWFRHRWL